MKKVRKRRRGEVGRDRNFQFTLVKKDFFLYHCRLLLFIHKIILLPYADGKLQEKPNVCKYMIKIEQDNNLF